MRYLFFGKPCALKNRGDHSQIWRNLPIWAESPLWFAVHFAANENTPAIVQPLSVRSRIRGEAVRCFATATQASCWCATAPRYSAASQLPATSVSRPVGCITSSNLVTTASLQVRRSAPIPSPWVSEHRLEAMSRLLKDRLLRQHVDEGISFQSVHSRRHVLDIVR